MNYRSYGLFVGNCSNVVGESKDHGDILKIFS